MLAPMGLGALLVANARLNGARTESGLLNPRPGLMESVTDPSRRPGGLVHCRLGAVPAVADAGTEAGSEGRSAGRPPRLLLMQSLLVAAGGDGSHAPR